MKKQEWMMAWVNLAHAGTYLTDELSTALRNKLGIGIAEQDLIKQVALNNGELTMSELAQRLYYSKAGITKMVDRLERDGLLARKPSAQDRRAIQIQLTATGKETFEKSKQILLNFISENFRAHLSDKEIVSLRDALQSLLSGLGRYEGQLKHLRGETSN